MNFLLRNGFWTQQDTYLSEKADQAFKIISKLQYPATWNAVTERAACKFRYITVAHNGDARFFTTCNRKLLIALINNRTCEKSNNFRSQVIFTFYHGYLINVRSQVRLLTRLLSNS